MKFALKTPLIAALIAIAGGAAAQSVDPAVDANQDGLLSFPEVITAYPEMTEDAFLALDLSGDGVLDAAEVAAAIEAGALMAAEG